MLRRLLLAIFTLGLARRLSSLLAQAERSMFWTTGTTGDGATTYTEAQLGELWRDLFAPNATIGSPNASEGVLRGVGGELAVTGASSPISVASGAAIAEGLYYRNDAALNVTIPTPSSNTRIDRIVIRVSHGTTRTARITRIAGTEGAGAPSLTQTAGTTWDIPIAQVSITTGGVITLTDQRSFCHFATKVSSAMLDAGAVVAHLGYTPWHAGNDGAGSGLDADLLDGQQGSSYARVNAASNFTTAPTISGNAIWHAGNDGNGSGLDADLVAGVAIEPIQRQGGHATNWSDVGTTNYSPTAIRIQTGSVQVSLSSGSGYQAVTFPAAFSGTPHVQLTANNAFLPAPPVLSTSGPSTTGMTIEAKATSGTFSVVVHWLAIGPA